MSAYLQPRSLAAMLSALRAECGHSQNVAHGLNDRDGMLYLLNRVQIDLWEDYEWPDLTVDRDIPLADGVRFYPYPSDLRFEDISKVWVYNGLSASVYELKYDITPEQYAVCDSTRGMESWPPQRWHHTQDNGSIEIWPIPDASATGSNLRLRGTATPIEMINDGDMPLLPWRLIVLSAAAEVLAKEQDPAAQSKSARAAEILRRRKVRTNSHKSGITSLLGGGYGHAAPRAGIDYIPVGYGSGPRRV